MLLKVQQYLKDHTFADLEREHGVYCSFNKTGHFFSANYDMIEAKESDPLSQECRGLILSKVDGSSFLSEAKQENGKTSYKHICPGDTRILCFGMKRFFNLGQEEAKIDWNDPKLSICEKADGTLIQVWASPFTGIWHVATRGVPEADLKMDNGIFTFRELFEKALFDTCGKWFDDFTQDLDRNITYCFELVSPLNRIVVRYDDYRIILLAARDLTTLQELDVMTVPMLPYIPRVRSYAIRSMTALVSWVSSFDPLQQEGIVVRDSNFQRVKIKNPAYVIYSKARDSLNTSERNCIEVILLEKDDDIIPFMPEEIVQNLHKLKEGLQRAIKEHDLVYQTLTDELKLMPAPNKKIFAIGLKEIAEARKGKIWTAPLFNRYDNKSANMHDFIIQNRKDGSWSASFLDKIVELAKHYY